MTTFVESRARRSVVLGIAGGLAATALPVRAQSFPAKPIRMVLPFPAGGPTDVVARAVAQSMSSQLGQPFVIENRAGANGAVASEHVARSAPDGYTLLYTTSSFGLSAALSRKLPFDPVADFAFVGLTTSTPLVLAVHPDFPARTTREFVEQLKANPGKYSYGAVQNAITHVAPVQALHAAGLRALHVPYKGSAQSIADLVGGQIHFVMDALNSALPFIRSGRIRALAISSQGRMSVLPDVPTVAESWLPGFDAGTWGAVLAPARTPAAVVTRLNQAIATTLGEAAFRSQVESQGLQILGGSPESCRSFVVGEIERWRKVARESNLPIE